MNKTLGEEWEWAGKVKKKPRAGQEKRKLRAQLDNDRAKLSDGSWLFVAVLCFVNTCMTHVRQPKSQQLDSRRE